MNIQNRDVVERNYKAFLAELPRLLLSHRGKHALMHDEKITDFFDTMRDAFLTGQRLYPDGDFSVQQVTDTPADLGFFSHAMP